MKKIEIIPLIYWITLVYISSYLTVLDLYTSSVHICSHLLFTFVHTFYSHLFTSSVSIICTHYLIPSVHLCSHLYTSSVNIFCSHLIHIYTHMFLSYCSHLTVPIMCSFCSHLFTSYCSHHLFLLFPSSVSIICFYHLLYEQMKSPELRICRLDPFQKQSSP